MTYEIPKALKYEEKIILGLTFRQLGFLGGGLMGAAVVFKTPLSLLLRVPIIIFLMGLGAGCAFLELDRKALNVFSFYKRPRRMGFLKGEIADFVGIKTIAGSSVVLKNGTRVAILQVMPINFSIKSKKDRGAVIAAFQRFLNSLDFPVQFLMRTVNLGLDDYLDYLRNTVIKKVSGRRNKNLKKMFEGYCEFLEKFIQENAVQDRLFYVVVPCRGCLSGNQPREELKIRAHLCCEGLSSCGLVARRLGTDQLISFFSSFFQNSVEINNDYLFPLTIFNGEVKN